MSKNSAEINSVQLVFKVRSITPERQIPIEDLGLSEKSLPAEVRSFLKEIVFPREQLRKIHTLRRHTELKLDRIAIKDEVTKAWILNHDDSDLACTIVLNAEKEVDKEKARLKQLYPKFCQEVLDQVDETFGDYETIGEMSAKEFIVILKEAIKTHQPTWDYLENQIGVFYNFRPCAEISSDNPEVFKVFQKSYEQQKQSLFSALLKQVATRAEEILQLLFNGDDIRRSTIQTVEVMQAKVKRLSFLDKRLLPLANGMLTVIKDIPQSGNIIPVKELGGSFIAMMTLLSDENRLLKRLDNDETLIFKADASTSVTTMSVTQPVNRARTGKTNSSPIRKLKGVPITKPIKKTGLQLKIN